MSRDFRWLLVLLPVMIWVPTAYGGSDPDLERGFPAKAYQSSGTFGGGAGVHLLVGNIDADPELEILSTGLAVGPLFAWEADGSPVAGWPTRDAAGAAYPVLANFSKKFPGYEVLSGTWGEGRIDARIVANGGDGSLLTGWPRYGGNYVSDAPTAADVDGDTIDEIFMTKNWGDIWAYRADGTRIPGWPAPPRGYYDVRTPSVADLNGDGLKEIIGSQDGWVVAYEPDASWAPGFPVNTGSGYYIQSYTAVGDVDGDGELEIVVVKPAGVVVVGHTGIVKRTIPLAGSVEAGFLLAGGLQHSLAHIPPGWVWSPARVASAWSRRLRGTWCELPEDVRTGGCEFLLVGAFPGRQPPLCHSDAYRFRAPQFELERLPRGHATSIGSGSEVTPYIETLESFSEDWSQLAQFSLQPFPAGPGGPMSVVLSDLIRDTPVPGVSSQLIACLVGPSATSIFTLESPIAGVTTPPLASTLEEFRQLCRERALASRAAIAGSLISRYVDQRAPGQKLGKGRSARHLP